MMDSWQVVKNSMDRVGVKKVAAGMKLSPSLVYRWAQPMADSPGRYSAASGVLNPLDRVARLVEITGDNSLVQWLCRRIGGFFVPDPTITSEHGNLAVLRHTQAMIQDFSGVLEAVSKALANDQLIDEDEAKQIRQAWERLKQAGETFAVCCEHGCFDKEAK